MRRIILILVFLTQTFIVSAQTRFPCSKSVPNRVVLPDNPTQQEHAAAQRLLSCLPGWESFTESADSLGANSYAIYLGNTMRARKQLGRQDEIRDDGYRIFSDGTTAFVVGGQGKAPLYGACKFLELMGFRMTTPTPDGMPDCLGSVDTLPVVDLLCNPTFRYREILYANPNISQAYADWHGLHNRDDLRRDWGMFVHTFQHLIPSSRYYDTHPEWFSQVGGRRVRDGQLCLSNPQLLDTLCANLALLINQNPRASIWSVSNNDNYNVCQCPECRRLDSLYGGPSGTLVYFVNQVARRFPDKTISTLAYQFSRQAPLALCPIPQKPDTNVNIMFCSIECGRQLPLASNPAEAHFCDDMRHWADLTNNIFLWDYVVQFRNFWDPFPNIHVLQPNLQFFRDNGVKMMFEQGTGEKNITAWIDFRCYLLAKLLWDVDADVDSLSHDFCLHHYGPAGPHILHLFNAMSDSLLVSGKRLDIYGYPVDAADGYLSPQALLAYREDLRQAYLRLDDIRPDTAVAARLRRNVRAVELSLDYAQIELTMAGFLPLDSIFLPLVDNFVRDFQLSGGKYLHEMGYTIQEYRDDIDHFLLKTFRPNLARHCPVSLRKVPSPLYASGDANVLTDGKAGILDYRHDWLGVFGDTLDVTIDLRSRRSVDTIALDCFFYPLSWIFLPQSVEFFLSNDGRHWDRVGELSLQSPQLLAVPDIYTFSLPSVGRKARYVRVRALPIPEIPAWHRATGNPAWIFVDEILVR